MELMIIENDVEKIKIYDQLGVDRIFIDLEKLGKEERQKGLNTVKSNHSFEDIVKAKKVVKNSKLLVRINPLNQNSNDEVDKAIDCGADIIMLPYFRTSTEVENFINIINGRVRTSLLLESAQAFIRIENILKVEGIDEIHIGLNDLHLDLGLNFMLELYDSPYLELISKLIKERGISFGIGGVAPMNLGDVPGKYVLNEGRRIGSERVILSRAFPKDDLNNFKAQLLELRSELKRELSLDEYENNRKLLHESIIEFLSKNC